MNHSEIWGCEFGKPDKFRPVLILTRSEMIPLLNTVTVAPITRTIRGVASEVLVGTGEGLKEESVINLHHVMTVPRKNLRRFIGGVKPAKMKKVFEALLFALGGEDQ